VRLTLLYSPKINPKTAARFLPDQATQDWGHHEFTYGLASHAGDYRQAQTDWQALRLNQPLVSFVSPSHPGALGKEFSLLRVNHPRVRILALKKAEDSDEIVVRLVAMDAQANSGIRLRFAAPVTAAREITSQEKPLGAAKITDGQLDLDLTPFELRSFAVNLAAAREPVPAPVSQPVALPYDLAVASQDGTPAAGGFDAEGRSLAAEMLPATLRYAGITFHLAPAAAGKPNAVVTRGQTIALPAGKFNRLYLLAASAEGDQAVTFRIGEARTAHTIQSWGGFIGQWDNRRWSAPREQGPPGYDFPDAPPPKFPEYLGLTPGFVKPAPVAWFASHRHTAKGENQPYAYSYLYAYLLEVPPGATTLTLPDNPQIRILAATAVDESPGVNPAHPLYDMLARSDSLAAR
jgi:alpha-mannosidase